MSTITCMSIAGAVKHVCTSKCTHRGCVPHSPRVEDPIERRSHVRRIVANPDDGHHHSSSSLTPTASPPLPLVNHHSVALKPRAATRVNAGRAALSVVAEEKKASRRERRAKLGQDLFATQAEKPFILPPKSPDQERSAEGVREVCDSGAMDFLA